MEGRLGSCGSIAYVSTSDDVIMFVRRSIASRASLNSVFLSLRDRLVLQRQPQCASLLERWVSKLSSGATA